LQTGKWCTPKAAATTLYEQQGAEVLSATPRLFLGGLVACVSFGLLVTVWRRAGRGELRQSELLVEETSDLDQ